MNDEEISAERKRLIKDLVFGKFIVAFTKPPSDDLKLNVDYKMIYVRLSEIKSVEYLYRFEDDSIDACFFNTYKDYKYFTYLKAGQLIDVINNEAFELKSEQENMEENK